MRKSQAEQRRVVRLTKTELESIATRAGAYVTWGEPDRQGFYTPTVYDGTVNDTSGTGVAWPDVLLDIAAVAMAIAAGVLFGVVLS